MSPVAQQIIDVLTKEQEQEFVDFHSIVQEIGIGDFNICYCRANCHNQ